MPNLVRLTISLFTITACALANANKDSKLNPATFAQQYNGANATNNRTLSSAPTSNKNTQNIYNNVNQQQLQTPSTMYYLEQFNSHKTTNYHPVNTTNQNFTTMPKRINLDRPMNAKDYPVGKPTLSCVADIASKHNIPLEIMLAVQSVERGNTGQAVRNTNGTYDLGAFQINTIHLDFVKKNGGTKEDVLKRGCFNAEIAGKLLKRALNEKSKQHLDLYTRASGYHSWTPVHNQRYRTKLVKYANEWKSWLNANFSKQTHYSAKK